MISLKTTASVSPSCAAVLANKPAEMASTALIHALRKHLGIRRIGHTGTLDRFASGLMLLLTGKATSFAEFFLHADKNYLSEFSFGVSTDTQDSHGKIIQEVSNEKAKDFLRAHETELTEYIQSWVDLKEQIPPVYSSIKQNGMRLSEHARLGHTVHLKPRKINVYESKVLSYEPEERKVEVFLKVSGGTYVRSFARDIGEKFGIPVHLHKLCRTQVSSSRLEDDAWVPNENEPKLLCIQDILPSWPRVTIDRSHAAKIAQGMIVRTSEMTGSLPEHIHQNFFIEDPSGCPLAWAVRSTGSYRYRRVLTS